MLSSLEVTKKSMANPWKSWNLVPCLLGTCSPTEKKTHVDAQSIACKDGGGEGLLSAGLDGLYLRKQTCRSTNFFIWNLYLYNFVARWEYVLEIEWNMKYVSVLFAVESVPLEHMRRFVSIGCNPKIPIYYAKKLPCFLSNQLARKTRPN